MSVCIEQSYQNNFSQNLSTCIQSDVSLVQRIVKRLQIWAGRSQQRKALARLDDHMLADIGVSRGQALQEMNKPFWK